MHVYYHHHLVVRHPLLDEGLSSALPFVFCFGQLLFISSQTFFGFIYPSSPHPFAFYRVPFENFFRRYTVRSSGYVTRLLLFQYFNSQPPLSQISSTYLSSLFPAFSVPYFLGALDFIQHFGGQCPNVASVNISGKTHWFFKHFRFENVTHLHLVLISYFCFFM